MKHTLLLLSGRTACRFAFSLALGLLLALLDTRGGATIDLVEIRAYGESLSDVQRALIVNELLTKYSL